ncbi:MAG: hypothetical protein AAF555_11780 [Verrucomicrobiota bacterium]
MIESPAFEQGPNHNGDFVEDGYDSIDHEVLGPVQKQRGKNGLMFNIEQSYKDFKK